MTRRRHLAPVPDGRRRCRKCRTPIDPAAEQAGQWTQNPDGTWAWQRTGYFTTCPSCDLPTAHTKTA